MSTIQEHYDLLRHQDPESFSAMNGALAGKWHSKSDCLTYFKRSVLPKEGKPDQHLNLAVLPYWIVKQLVDFLKFSWQDIESNHIPDLTSEPTEVAV